MKSERKTGKYLTVQPNGAALEAYRKVKNQTQKEVEEAIGILSPRLYLYEKGNRMPIKHLWLLAAYYEVAARKLIDPDSLEDCLDISQELLNGFGWTAEELANGTK